MDYQIHLDRKRSLRGRIVEILVYYDRDGVQKSTLFRYSARTLDAPEEPIAVIERYLERGEDPPPCIEYGHDGTRSGSFVGPHR